MDLIVTTTHKPSNTIEQLAGNFAEVLKIPYVSRDNMSLVRLTKTHHVDNILVVSEKGPILHIKGNYDFFFHPGMSQMRIKNIINGKHDHMISAMALTPGMSVLDCTLGLATDAIVASYVTGAGGIVIGLEISPLICLITAHGLCTYENDNQALIESLRRIEVVHADYLSYLITVPDKKFDIVYFDPMFRVPIKQSANMKPIRFLADKRPLDSTAINEACRVAKSRVVIKEKNGSSEFERLGINKIVGGKYSGISYGVIEVGE